MPQIKRLQIKGFRAFGSQPQVLEFRGPMAVVSGPNSQGKTSLAEAIEFLLTGKTVRRELLASAKREFAEALRNVYLSETEQVVVSAEIEDSAGQVHRVQRRLVRDYTGRDPCESELTIDGMPATDLTGLDIRLSQPPLEAPVLMTHTLRYVVSAEPQQRTEYFKALLEVSDLEEVRTAISDAKSHLAPPPTPAEAIYLRCLDNPNFGAALGRLKTGASSEQVVTEALRNALGLIISEAEPPPDSLEARLTSATRLLAERRATTFPVDALDLAREPAWTSPEHAAWQPLEKFARLKSGADTEASRLVRLFEAVLRVPGIAGATAPVDCPVCETPKALTPERVDAIRKQLEATAEFREAREAADRTLRSLTGLAGRIARDNAAGPLLLTWNAAERSRRGFSEPTIGSLLGERRAELIPPWREAVAALEALLSNLGKQASDLEHRLQAVGVDDLDATMVTELRQEMSALFECVEQFLGARRRYGVANGPLVSALRPEVDQRAQTEGWQDLVNLTECRQELLSWLAERNAYAKVLRDLEEAIQQIDNAKAQLLDDKFSQLSGEVRRWWNLLRPDETTSFYGIGRGGTGRRFIDLKARLTPQTGGPSSGVLRDAVAVFSDSQLNCLGLAAFLGRTVREGSRFVVLDDPVPASDEAHRAFFIDRVLSELVCSSIHVILLTYDERMSTEVQERYQHLNPEAFLVALQDPVAGATVELRSETLDALLARAAPHAGSPDPEPRKYAARTLRDAAERFCKLLLVRELWSRGDSNASVSDYDGKNLGELGPMVEPLLTRDSSHPGKLRVIRMRLNPGSHDDAVPPPGDLKQCLGDLKFLRKEYLS